jgi:hypothetical protein
MECGHLWEETSKTKLRSQGEHVKGISQQAYKEEIARERYVSLDKELEMNVAKEHDQRKSFERRITEKRYQIILMLPKER